MITVYDKAIAGFLTAALSLLASFNLEFWWFNATTISSITPFIVMIVVYLVPNRQEPVVGAQPGGVGETAGSVGPISGPRAARNLSGGDMPAERETPRSANVGPTAARWPDPDDLPPGAGPSGPGGSR